MKRLGSSEALSSKKDRSDTNKLLSNTNSTQLKKQMGRGEESLLEELSRSEMLRRAKDLQDVRGLNKLEKKSLEKMVKQMSES